MISCNVRVPICGMIEYYISDAADEADAKNRAFELAQADCSAHGRRFELEAVTDLADASYREIEMDDVEEDGGDGDDGEVE